MILSSDLTLFYPRTPFLTKIQLLTLHPPRFVPLFISDRGGFTVLMLVIGSLMRAALSDGRNCFGEVSTWLNGEIRQRLGTSRFAVTTLISSVSCFALVNVMELWGMYYSMWIGVLGEDLGYECWWSVGFSVRFLVYGFVCGIDHRWNWFWPSVAACPQCTGEVSLALDALCTNVASLSTVAMVSLWSMKSAHVILLCNFLVGFSCSLWCSCLCPPATTTTCEAVARNRCFAKIFSFLMRDVFSALSVMVCDHLAWNQGCDSLSGNCLDMSISSLCCKSPF